MTWERASARVAVRFVEAARNPLPRAQLRSRRSIVDDDAASTVFIDHPSATARGFGGKMNVESLKRTKRRGLLLALLLTALSVQHAGAQTECDDATKTKAQVLILGVYHFDNPNRDYLKTRVDDHLAVQRQRQIVEVVELLARYKPTKIALEAIDEAELQRKYEAYLKGEHALTAGERDQLGFRLAEKLGHRRVHAIDSKLDMDVASVVAAARTNGDRAFLEFFQNAMGELQAFERRKGDMTVREILISLNEPERIARGRDDYMQLARVRDADRYVGADALAAWYQRNFRIFTNLVRAIDSPCDRVLLIMGSSHAAILREAVQSSPDLQLVEANDYLKGR